MFGLNDKNKNNKPKKQSLKSSKSSQSKEAKELLAAMAKKKKDKPDDCVFCQEKKMKLITQAIPVQYELMPSAHPKILAVDRILQEL